MENKKAVAHPDAEVLYELIHHVFNQEAGKKLLELIKKVFMDRPTWAIGQDDNLIHFQEGQRQLIMFLVEAAKREKVAPVKETVKG